MESKSAATSGSGTLLPARLRGATGSPGSSRSSGCGLPFRAAPESTTLGTLREGRRQLGLALPVQWPALESTREDDLGLGREDVWNLLDTVQSPLEMASVDGSHLEQIVGLAGQMVAFLDLVDVDEITREVGRDRAWHLLDEDECENTVAEQGRIGDGDIASDDPPGLELLDPLMGRRPAH